jgi:hypothetical protein
LTRRRKTELAWQAVGEEGIVVDLQAREVMGLNPAAALVWSLLPSHDEEAIVAKMVRRFATDADTARRDLRAFVAELVRRGLVSEA